MVTATDTDADGEAGDGTAAPSDGADETGGAPVLSSHCLMEPAAGLFGYKYQCSGNVFIEVSIAGEFEGSPVFDSIELEFGPSAAEDSYEHPHVMACCPEYDPELPNCAQEHEQFCMADLAEQGCKSIEPNLREFADEAFGESTIEDAIKRAAVRKIADYVRDHQSECIARFVAQTEIGTTLPSCDEEGNGVGYDTLLETGVWIFDPKGVVDTVQVAVAEANWTGVHPLGEPLVVCESADDNDDVLFLELDPDPDAMIMRLAAGGATLHGPEIDGEGIHGVGVFASEASACQPEGCSVLAIHIDSVASKASLENLELHAAASADVRIADDVVTIDDVHVRLWDGTPARIDEGGESLVIPRGTARFAVSAASEGLRGVVTATNETDLHISRTASGWATTELILGYEDELGGYWTLSVMPAQWR